MKKFSFNKKTVAALIGVLVTVLVAFGVKDSDKVKGVLEALAAFVPETTETVPAAPDAGLPPVVTPENLPKVDAGQ